MDINTLRTGITLLCFIAYICIVFWAYQGRQRGRFEEAANLPFADDDMQRNTVSSPQDESNSPASGGQ